MVVNSCNPNNSRISQGEKDRLVEILEMGTED